MARNNSLVAGEQPKIQALVVYGTLYEDETIR